MNRKWWGRKRTFLMGIPVLPFLIGIIFVNSSPEFGAMPNSMDKLRYAASPQFVDGKFKNLSPTDMSMSAKDFLKTLKGFIGGGEGRTPKEKIHVLHPNASQLASATDVTDLVWFGHSAFLLQIDGKNILIDPMFGAVPAPHPWLGRARFTDGLPIEVAALPMIDAMLISHDHYDHLDHGSIQKLKAKTKEFYVPLGVGAHLKAWGVEEERIHEMDWWDETNFADLQIAFTPARHFSGRGLTDRFSTLWGSWVVKGKEGNIFFSGDSGYDTHFKDIGEKFGPFDLAMIECGQYNEKWPLIHMMPEQSAQAAIDVRARMMMPIHWGSFVLAMHSWTDPVERVVKKAEELGMPIVTPRIGEVIDLHGPVSAGSAWWKNI